MGRNRHDAIMQLSISQKNAFAFHSLPCGVKKLRGKNLGCVSLLALDDQFFSSTAKCRMRLTSKTGKNTEIPYCPDPSTTRETPPTARSPSSTGILTARSWEKREVNYNYTPMKSFKDHFPSSCPSLTPTPRRGRTASPSPSRWGRSSSLRRPGRGCWEGWRQSGQIELVTANVLQ